jgi:plastocyanin
MALLTGGAAHARTTAQQTFTLQVDATPPTGEPWAFLRFFPSSLKVHQGDIIDAAWQATDTPHTATLVPTTDPDQWRTDNQSPGGPYATFESDSAIGGDDNDTIINPAVGFPSDPTCGTSTTPCTFDGSSIVNAGLLNPNPSDEPSFFTQVTAPVGSYSFMCLLHPGMQIPLQVVPDTQRIPTPDDVAQRAADQAAQATTVDGHLADSRAQAVKVSSLGQGNVLWTISAGGFAKNVTANEFLDSGLTVRVGDQVRVNGNFEIHTATTPADKAPSRVPFIVPACEVPGPDTPPPCAPGVQFVLNVNSQALLPTAKNDLSTPEAFRNSGLLTPGTSFTFDAAKPGVYAIVCLVHGPEMSTVITVES